MPIPDFQSLMLPVLKVVGDGAEHRVAEIRNPISQDLKLTPDELAEKLKSGTPVFADRVAWALAYLKKAGALKSSANGVYQITDLGTALLNKNFLKITIKILNDTSNGIDPGPFLPITELPPEEQIENSFKLLRDALADDILEAVKKVSPSAFEQIVVDLLVKMGYGGSLDEAGEVVGRRGDAGIDGIIKQDKLGLDAVYVQAKRYRESNVVGASQLRDFCGSLSAHKATKGVFITASHFSKDASDYVKRIPHTMVLIDGEKLADLMIEHGIGVQAKRSYTIKRLDQDYFDNL